MPVCFSLVGKKMFTTQKYWNARQLSKTNYFISVALDKLVSVLVNCIFDKGEKMLVFRSNLTSLLLLTLNQQEELKEQSCKALTICSSIMDANFQSHNPMHNFIQHQCEKVKTYCSKDSSDHHQFKRAAMQSPDQVLAGFVQDYLDQIKCGSVSLLLSRSDFKGMI